MCIFTGPVLNVHTTYIFARQDGMGGQYLVYSMAYGASSDLAMILPLPVSSHAEDAVEFISLEDYEDFFEDMVGGFEKFPINGNGGDSRAIRSDDRLKVHEVGAYEASFVPNLKDFDRLEPRFKLPTQVWDQLPRYRTYGFAVFKLKATASDTQSAASESRRVHPMAFRFPTRRQDLLFFPTVHVHDGQVHEREHFDHNLLFQSDAADDGVISITPYVNRTYKPAARFMRLDKTEGIVEGRDECFGHRVYGKRSNTDIWADAHSTKLRK